MTDEEKRKNFLERNRFVSIPFQLNRRHNTDMWNRVAALKCKQRKRQWLTNLQQKVEIYSEENDSLSAQVSQLRDEVLNLKTKLIAHKDCEVTRERWPGGLGQITWDR